MAYACFMLSLICAAIAVKQFPFYYCQMVYWMVLLCFLIRMAMLPRLISYCYPASTLVRKMVLTILSVFIPYPEVQFLRCGESKVLVRDFWLPPVYRNVTKIAKLIRREYFAQPYEDDDSIVVALRDADTVCVRFDAFEMLLVKRLSGKVDPKQVMIPKGNPWRLESTIDHHALVCTEKVCYFAEKEELAKRIIALCAALEEVELFARI